MPVLVIGVSNFVHAKGYSAATAMIRNATDGASGSQGDGGSSLSSVAMIFGGSFWGFVMCMGMLVGKYQCEDSQRLSI